MRNPEINFGKDIRENYGEHTVAVQVRDEALLFNTLLILNDHEVAVVRNNGNGDKNVFDTSEIINKPDDNKRRFSRVAGKYTITYLNTKPCTARVSICDDVRVECEYKIINPERVMEYLLFDSSKVYCGGLRIHIASDGSITKLIKDRVTNPISGEIDRWKEKGVLLKKIGEINSLVKECLENEEVLEKTGLKIEHVNVVPDRTKSAEAVPQKQEEPSKQPEISVEEIKAVVRSEIKGSEERLGAKIDENTERSIANQDKNTEKIKSLFIAGRDDFVKVYLDKLKNDQDLSDITKDIKKYFDAKNGQVYDEIKKIADKIESKERLTEEEYIQIAETIAHSDPKDLKNTPQLTLNFIVDNISKEWHASAAADVIYHQLEKWLSKKKITSAEFNAQELLRFFEKCQEVFEKNGECILDKSFKKTGSEIEHQPFKQKEWVLLEDVKGGIKPRNGLKCYFALLDNDVRKNDVNSSSKNTIYQCKKADKYWRQMNAMRHFGTPDSMKKLSEQGLSDIKVRQKLLIEITKFFKTGAFETEDVLADII